METASTVDDQSLMDFVAGTSPAADTFPIIARGLMTKFARSAAPELPRDLQDEVVSQSLEYLIVYGTKFESARGSAKAFLKVMAGQAARKVRADYRPPGCKTRPTREAVGDRATILPISVIDLEDTTHTEDLDTVCEVRAILKRAPDRIARALFLIYFDGETVASAAHAVGISRFSLSREIARFMSSVREANAA